MEGHGDMVGHGVVSLVTETSTCAPSSVIRAELGVPHVSWNVAFAVTWNGVDRGESPYEIPPTPQTKRVRDATTRATASRKRFRLNPRSNGAAVRQFPRAEFVRSGGVDPFVFILL